MYKEVWQPLKDPESGRMQFPAMQPQLPRKYNYFLCGNACGCCPPYILFVPVLGAVAYVLGLVGVLLLLVAVLILYVVLGCCGCSVLCYAKSWRCPPFRWMTDLYPKVMYLVYQAILKAWVKPSTTPEFMPVAKLAPKEPLEKKHISYALNIKVPRSWEEEFLEHPTLTDRVADFVEGKISLLPQVDTFDAFAPDENPVEYVMNQLGSIFPEVYQVWDEKWSDAALTRFCLYGLGAHRIETTKEGGNSYYVVRTNALSGLPVRPGFERYGGDAYFDMSWRPVKIVDKGLGRLLDDGREHAVTSTPQDAKWEHAKFRFRSSLSVLVTLVDHLYGIHLQTSNVMVTAMREQLSPSHPLRRFLTPFTFNTISVNSSAMNNLIQPRSMGPRCFAFDDVGMQLAFAAAPKLVMSGMEVSPAEGGPFVSRAAYIDYLKNKRGIDTEYHRQSKKYYLILRKFVVDYLACYFPSMAHVVGDPEIQAMIRQATYQVEFMSPTAVPASHATEAGVSEAYNGIVDLIANLVFVVTAGHEQTGAVEAYVQDASFCAFKWVPGALAGTKQTATAQALLMSFTSKAMPKLLGSDWTHLFPPCGSPQSPVAAFAEFQQALQAFSQECDAYNAAAPTRPFPECFPMYVLNPKLLETSIAV